MELIITFIFIISILANFFLYQNNKEINQLRIIEKNSYKKWLDEEVQRKRTYYNLSEKLIYENRELKQENKILNLKKNRLFKLLHKNDRHI